MPSQTVLIHSPIKNIAIRAPRMSPYYRLIEQMSKLNHLN